MQKKASPARALSAGLAMSSGMSLSGRACSNQPNMVRHRFSRATMKTLLVMKLTFMLLTAALLSAHATVVAQHVTISGKDLSLNEIFSAIKKQTGYVVFSSKEDLVATRPVTLSASRMPLADLLTTVFREQPLEYTIRGKTIVISRKASAATFMQIVAPQPVTGTVMDSVGKPVQGVSVRLTPGNRGTTTNADGSFIIRNVEPGSYTVEISLVGHYTISKKIIVDGNTPVALGSFTVQVNPRAMNEVVITNMVNTGYQRILPQQVTGAVAQIRTKDFESRISTDLLSGLQNRLPGLLINNDVQFQGNNLFQIRGISTMTGNPRPLIVLDGYPTDLSLNDVNPNEIETVTILKDAAAAAIYGVRASNGVIIIDRKKGVAGNPQFAFRSTVGVRPRENYSRYRYDPDGSINAYYRKQYWETNSSSFTQYRNNAMNGENPILYGGTGEDINLLVDYSLGKITKEQMEAGYAAFKNQNNAEDYERYFLRNAVTSQYNLNISGGTQKALYYITGNYLQNNSGRKNNDDRKIQLSGRTNLQLSSRLSLELLTDYNESSIHEAPIPDINKIYPYEKFADANGNPLPIMAGSAAAGSLFTNSTMKMGFYDQRMYPLVEMNEVNTRRRIADYRVTTNLRYKIANSLDLSLGGIYERSQMQQRRIATENSAMTRQYINRYIQLPTGTTPLTYNIPKGGYMQRFDTLMRSFTGRAQLNFNKQFSGVHSVNAILGAEIRKTVSEGSKAAYFGYNDQTLLQQAVDYSKVTTSGNSFNPAFIFYNPSLALNDLFGQSYNDDRFVSGYMNAVYSYKSRYSFTGSLRIDQSNLFGTDPKYRYKPLWSLGAAWNISSEHFMQDVSWVDMLKLRVARGFNGNVSKASLPQVIASYALNDVALQRYAILNLSSPANSGLRWEQTDNFNVGVDFTIFRHISGNVDYYKKRSTDVLGNIDIDPFKGVTPALVNQASINNQGVEFTINADWMRKRKMNWNTGLVMSYNRSKVLEAYVPKPTTVVVGTSNPILTSQQIITAAAGGYMKGEQVGIIYSYRYAGIDDKGNALYYNSKGNKALMSTQTDEGFASLDSRGTSIPALNMGLSNRVDVGNFYFFCMLNFYGGFVVKAPVPNPSVVRPVEGAGSFWRKAGDEATVELPSSGYLAASGSTYLANSDRYIMNGAYFTIGDITASYNLRNVALLQKAGFNNFEIKAQVSNLYTVGFNKDNYSVATGSYLKPYITPTYTVGLFTNF